MARLDPKQASQAENGDAGAKQRLVDAAEKLFSEFGYKGASVRKIATAAKCNIAGVNYYFGGKDKLYYEVWRRQLTRLRNVRLDSLQKVMAGDAGQPSLQDVLKAFAYSFLGPLLEDDRLMKLMAHEMLDEHLPANILIDEMIKPTMTAMRNALLKTCPELDESRIPLVVFSIVGQLLHIVRIKSMFEQIESVMKLDINEAVEHIVKFSAAGIRAYTSE